MASFRRLYGRERPWHLLAMLLTYAITGYAVWAIFQNAAPWGVLLWLGLAIVAHDFVFLPLYVAAYRAAGRLLGAGRGRRRRVVILQHLAVPAMLSLLLLLLGLPLVLQLSERNYRPTTGMTQDPYLERWMGVSAALFAVSAVVYLIRRRGMSRAPADGAPAAPDRPGR